MASILVFTTAPFQIWGTLPLPSHFLLRDSESLAGYLLCCLVLNPIPRLFFARAFFKSLS